MRGTAESYMSVAEAADYLAVSPARVYALIAAKRVKSVWDYGRRWVAKADLEKYDEDRKVWFSGEDKRVADAPCSQSSG